MTTPKRCGLLGDRLSFTPPKEEMTMGQPHAPGFTGPGGCQTARGPGHRLRAGTIIGVMAATIYASLAFPSPALAASSHIPCGDVAGLKAAINAANTTPSKPTIIHLASACQYELTGADNGENGLPVIGSPITVMGNRSTIGRSGALGTPGFRIWEVGSTGSLTLNHLSVVGGTASRGAGILNDGGRLTLTVGRVIGNVVRTTGSAAGGGIYNTGTATIVASQVQGNLVDSSGDVAEGGGIENSAGSLTLRASQVFANSVSSSGDAAIGGGIDNGFGATLTLIATEVYGNTASSLNELGGGGGISNVGSVVLNSSQVHDNTARSTNGNARGGAISDVGQFTLNASQVYGNTSISAGVVGGGIYTGGGITIKSSQIFGNTADNTGTEPGEGSGGGGIFIAGGASVFTDTSITRNRAVGQDAHGGGVALVGAAALVLVNSLVTANVPDNCFPPGSVSGCSG